MPSTFLGKQSVHGSTAAGGFKCHIQLHHTCALTPYRQTSSRILEFNNEQIIAQAISSLTNLVRTLINYRCAFLEFPLAQYLIMY